MDYVAQHKDSWPDEYRQQDAWHTSPERVTEDETSQQHQQFEEPVKRAPLPEGPRNYNSGQVPVQKPPRDLPTKPQSRGKGFKRSQTTELRGRNLPKSPVTKNIAQQENANYQLPQAYSPVIDRKQGAEYQEIPQHSLDGYPQNDQSTDFYEEDYAESSKSSRGLWIACFIFAVLFFCFGLYTFANSKIKSSGEPGQVVVVDIPSGSTSKDISKILETEGIIPSSSGFDYYVKVRGGADNLKAGSYELNQNISVSDALDVLNEGPTANDQTILPEGLWVSEILVELDKQIPSVTAQELQIALDAQKSSLKYVPDGILCPEQIPNCVWEGMLFPAQYEFPSDVTADQVIKTLNDEFNKVASEVGLDDPAVLNGRDPYEIIIVASMIESEAAVDSDRPKIAEVIYHRMSGDELSNSWLGIDATVIYSLGSRNPGDDVIIARHKVSDDPYNTSALGGASTRGRIPQTPISAPGRSSLLAALNPSNEGYKWYTLPDPDTNEHTFSTNKADHDAADAAYDKKIAESQN